MPTVLGVDAESASSRRAELHERLAQIPCSIYYDPTVSPNISGLYRYTAKPVPIPKRFFHPKVVAIAGETKNGTIWVYLAVSSANITLSGWGRNVESFGETWIHTRQQQPWSVLDRFLAWLDAHASLEEERSNFDAVNRTRKVLGRMTNRRRFNDKGDEPWSGTLNAQLYVSVVQSTQSFPEFLQESSGRQRHPNILWAYSPYWSDVSEQVSKFNARETVLVPAWRVDGKGLGISNDQAEEIDKTSTEIRRNEKDVDSRFWHMKAYWIEHGDLIRTAVGSCNFTRAGLGGGDNNVEAMLVYEAGPEWLPNGDPYEEGEFSDEIVPEEDMPQVSPLPIVVGWDWRTQLWRWWLKPQNSQNNFRLTVPGLDAFSITAGTSSRSGKEPRKGAQFTVDYQDGEVSCRWQGQIVELNLDHSQRVYGAQLTANEILDSWKSRTPPPPPPEPDEGEPGPSNYDGGVSDNDYAPAAFDAVNLFDLYRSTRALRRTLNELSQNPDVQRAYLVGRHYSAISLANMADRDAKVPVVRYLVLKEISGIVNTWKDVLDSSLVSSVEQKTEHVRSVVRDLLLNETKGDETKSDNMLAWFEREFSELDLGRHHEAL